MGLEFLGSFEKKLSLSLDRPLLFTPKSFNFLDPSQKVDLKSGLSLGPSQNVLSEPAKKLASEPGLGLRPDPSLLGIVTI